MRSLKGKRALVTGAASGIGREIANELAGLGHQYFAGRTSLTFLTREPLPFRLQEGSDAVSIVLTETARSDAAEAASRTIWMISVRRTSSTRTRPCRSPSSSRSVSTSCRSARTPASASSPWDTSAPARWGFSATA